MRDDRTNSQSAGSYPVIIQVQFLLPRLLSYYGEICTKGLFHIIQISNDECNYLLSKGYRWHVDLVHTVSAANKKYAVERKALLKDLDEFRKSRNSMK